MMEIVVHLGLIIWLAILTVTVTELAQDQDSTRDHLKYVYKVLVDLFQENHIKED